MGPCAGISPPLGAPCYGVCVFSFGLMEIAVICLLAVILFPPRELPKLARTVARFYGTVRRTADDFRAAIMEDPDLNEPIDEIKTAYRQTRWEVRRAEEAARRELAKARMDARMAARGGAGSGPSADDGAEDEPKVGRMQGRVAAGELDDELEDELDDELEMAAEADPEDDPEDVHGPIGAPAAPPPPLVPPPPPLTVAPDPDDDPGGGRSDRSQGAA